MNNEEFNVTTSVSPEVEKKEMEKKKIVVPSGLRYIGDWVGPDAYDLRNYDKPHILNKVLTGCGFTEYCIRNNQDLILCSPRKMLLENKESQHPEPSVYYARNEIDEDITNYEQGFTLSDGKKKLNRFTAKIEHVETEEEKEKRQQRITSYKDKIKNHVRLCRHKGLPCKILVTYDSFRHVKEALTEMKVLSRFQVVVDEFQSILVDCKFKSSTELELLEQLRKIDKVCFVSATPMLDKYLRLLTEFRKLPYYEFDWTSQEPSRIIKPNISVHKSENINQDIVKVVYSYKDGKFEKDRYIDDQGQIHEVVSNECVLYVNSVKLICSMIARCELFPEQCNVLCARTPENEEKVRKAFNQVYKKFGKKKRIKKGEKVIGHVPVLGETHKMFTFCTRTVYLGADFYSTCARSFIFCDSNIDCLSVDISMDLPQILGRQRLIDNPWKNYADIYVKSTIYKLKKEDFDRKMDEKVDATNRLLNIFGGLRDTGDQRVLADNYEVVAVSECYKRSYVAVNRHDGTSLKPVFNQLMQVSEIRAFDIQQMDYADRVSIFNTLRKTGFETIEVDSYLERFGLLKTYPEKMEYICQLAEILEKDKFILFLNSIPKSFKNYFIVLGPECCKAHRYRYGELEKEYQRQLNNQGVSLDDRIYDAFHAGERLFKPVVKERLAKIYKEAGYQATAKAVDIEKWFKVKTVQMKHAETGKRENAFELISRIKK